MRREQILRKAASEFAERGYYATTITHILDGLGIARGTFYLYFENKRAIFEELLKNLTDRLAGAIAVIDVEHPTRTPREQLNDNLERVFRVLLEDPSTSIILLEGGRGGDPDFERRVQEFFDHAHFLLKRSLIRGREMGLLRPIDTDLFADCIFGAVKEVVRRVAKSPGAAAEVPMLVDRLIEYHAYGVFET